MEMNKARKIKETWQTRNADHHVKLEMVFSVLSSCAQLLRLLCLSDPYVSRGASYQTCCLQHVVVTKPQRRLFVGTGRYLWSGVPWSEKCINLNPTDFVISLIDNLFGDVAVSILHLQTTGYKKAQRKIYHDLSLLWLCASCNVCLHPRQIFAPCAASERLLVADLTEEFRSKATLVTPLVEVRFAPQDFGLGAVLCASRGCTVMIWSIGECEEKRDRGLLPQLLKCISLEDGALGANIITSMDLSWNWGQVKHAKVKSNKEANVLLALGTNHGHLITKKLTCKSAQSNATLTVSPLEQIEVESTVTDVVVYSDPAADGTDFVIAIAQGIKVSAVVIHASFSGRESLRHYAAGPPCHGMPIVSVCCDTAGVFSACNKETGSFVERVNVVSMDSTGHTVIWQLSEGKVCSF